MKATNVWYERNWRWFVLGTLFLATFLNYFDRQTLANAIGPISEEFGLSNAQRGNLLSAFIYVYAFCHIFIGFILDRLDRIRIFYMIMVSGWALTTILMGLVDSYRELLYLRYLLGFFEALNFPLCILLIARIFPAQERSFATGIFSSGGVLATLTSPYLVVYFSNNFDWRYSFIVSGLLALLWIIPWLIIFRKPKQRALSWPERSKEPLGKSILESSKRIFSKPSFWIVATIGIGIIPLMYFITQWLPTVMTQALHRAYDSKLPTNLAVIFVMQNFGMWVGGYLVMVFARKHTILNARKLAIGIGFVLIVSILIMTRAQSFLVSMIILSMFNFGIGMIIANQHSFKQDVDKENVGTVAALIGFIETSMAAFVVQRVGFITEETHDYAPVFWLLVGFAGICLIMSLVLNKKWMKIE